MTVPKPRADQDFLKRLDAVIGCMQCGGSLTGAVSDMWCDEGCSEEYAARHASVLPRTDYCPDDDAWSFEDLADLEPVGWIAPPVWRLPRSTGDLEADQRALCYAIETVQTPVQLRACDLRQDSLDERQRAIWVRRWRLPRSTGTYWHDQTDLFEAERTATTDAQRASCTLRRESLNERRKTRLKLPTPGRRASSWGIDDYTLSGVVNVDDARQVADALLSSCRRSSIRLSLRLEPLRYGRVLNSYGEVARWDASTARGPWSTPGSSPVLGEGDAVTISRNGETLRYAVERVGPGTSMTCRRAPEDDQPAVRADGP